MRNQRSDHHHKSRKICKSKSYKMDFNNILTNEPLAKSPKKPPAEKSPLKLTAKLHGIG